MKTWYLFRHALSTYSKHGYGDEVLSAQILPSETKPIEQMAQYFLKVPNSINFSSEIIRCIQTAQIISKPTGKQFATDKRLNEYHGESFEEFTIRVTSWLDGIEASQTASENILVCTHGAVIAALKHIILKGTFSEDNALDYPECGELWIIRDKKVESIDFNS